MEPLLYFVAGALIALALVFWKSRALGFLSQRPGDYAEEPGRDFDLRRDLAGPLTCDGVIFGPSGRVVSRFTGDFDVDWTGMRAVMRETFRYDSGEVQERAWNLELSETGQIRATAEDVVGEGQGLQCGPTVNMRYRLRLPPDTGGHVLSATDWMYLTPDGTIVNRSQFRKFGIKVVELVATIRKRDAT
ncbi:DUF3833 family protein [Salipiger mucosus]|uniref:Putative lipoprotein n=1 Tax=Salipiger mucosus DSM 16094 TaxID=1123237 RepID=S9QUP9_9RHOB|nr:DUF3833 family protein [Salipiger mucosus]EPX83363.1 Putative lipoprotein precursor [Salipiger mucosus DSM 16094]